MFWCSAGDYVCLADVYFHFCKGISRKRSTGEYRRYETRYVLHLFTSVFLNSFKDGFLSVVGEILYLKSTNEEKSCVVTD